MLLLRLIKSIHIIYLSEIDSFRSPHVHMLHRYIVFETLRPGQKMSMSAIALTPNQVARDMNGAATDVVQALITDYISTYSREDPNLLFHNVCFKGYSNRKFIRV